MKLTLKSGGRKRIWVAVEGIERRHQRVKVKGLGKSKENLGVGSRVGNRDLEEGQSGTKHPGEEKMEG